MNSYPGAEAESFLPSACSSGVTRCALRPQQIASLAARPTPPFAFFGGFKSFVTEGPYRLMGPAAAQGATAAATGATTAATGATTAAAFGVFCWLEVTVFDFTLFDFTLFFIFRCFLSHITF